MENIIKKLYQEDDSIAYEAIKLARKNKEEIIEYLLEEIKMLDKKYRNYEIDYYPLFIDRAIFLLAEFREKKLYPILMNLLNNPEMDSFNEIGTIVMDKIPTIVASIFDGDFEPVNKVLENKEIDEYTRSRLVASYIYFYENNFITKEDLIIYLRKLIKTYNGEEDDFYNELIDVVTRAKLIEMIDDIRELYRKEIVSLDYRGDYDSFIDELFNYDKKYLENIYQVEDAIKELSRFDKINDIDEDLYEKIDELIKKDLEDSTNTYSKTGRNEPCPCGSGKKFKKCCIDKQNDILPYQGYIDKSLAKYPKKNNNEGELDFYTFYKEEYINIDKLLYKALKYKRVPKIINRNLKAELEMEFNALE